MEMGGGGAGQRGEGLSSRTHGRRSRGAVLTLAWVLAVALIGVVAWWAVASVVDPGQGRASVLSPGEVDAVRAAQEAAAPRPTAGPEPGRSATPTPEPTQGPSGTAAGPGNVARTWDVAGGRIGVVCRGETLDLLYATPVDGWTVEIDHIRGDRLEVKFTSGESETEVHAVCAAGVPTDFAENDTHEDR